MYLYRWTNAKNAPGSYKIDFWAFKNSICPTVYFPTYACKAKHHTVSAPNCQRNHVFEKLCRYTVNALIQPQGLYFFD